MKITIYKNAKLKAYMNGLFIGCVASVNGDISLEIEKLISNDYVVRYYVDGYGFISFYGDVLELREIDSDELIRKWGE